MSGYEMPIAMAVIAMAAAGASAYVSSTEQAETRKGQAKLAAYNAQLAARDERIEKQRSISAEERHRRESVIRRGGVRAAYGVSGVQLVGSPVDVMADMAAEEELEALFIRYQGGAFEERHSLRSQQLKNQAGFYEWGAKSAQQAGYIKTGLAVVGTAASAYGASGTLSGPDSNSSGYMKTTYSNW
jgi:alkanesulfonate monooxygenase SsuD/methylene tetrahydromethanopterin reductase-like flavin-dependent oxidoreductase (luciferase family)